MIFENFEKKSASRSKNNNFISKKQKWTKQLGNMSSSELKTHYLDSQNQFGINFRGSHIITAFIKYYFYKKTKLTYPADCRKIAAVDSHNCIGIERKENIHKNWFFSKTF